MHYWPCRFCGRHNKGKLHIYELLGIYGVECKHCDAVAIKGCDSAEQARRLWNKLNRPKEK